MKRELMPYQYVKKMCSGCIASWGYVANCECYSLSYWEKYDPATFNASEFIEKCEVDSILSKISIVFE